MDDFNVSVGQDMVQSVQDDAVQAAPDIQEAADGSVGLSELFGGTEDAPQETQPGEPEGRQGGTEQYDSGIRGRINAEVRKALTGQQQAHQAEIAALREEMWRQMMPLQAMALEREADALVTSGKFGDKETALEYLHLKSGMPVHPQGAGEQGAQDAPPRDAQGRFMSRQDAAPDPVRQRAAFLKQQADDIVRSGGPDVAQIFAENEEVRQMVLTGRVDFADVARAARELESRGVAPQRNVPAPVRNPNHAATSRSPHDMSDDEVDRIMAAARGGQKIDMRR